MANQTADQMIKRLVHLYNIVETLTDQSGQDKNLTLELSQHIILAIINNDPLVSDYRLVLRYCDVYDSDEHARRIADSISQ
jgi:hypothetical protein